MILTEYSICHYLLGKGLIDIATVVAGNFSVRRRKSRNNNFIVNSEQATKAYFIKQVDGLDTDKIGSLGREAAFYQLILTSPSFNALSAYAPSFVLYDNSHHILVTELIRNSITAQQYYYTEKNNELPTGSGIGSLLSVSHSCTMEETTTKKNFLPGEPPWVFSVAQTGDDYMNSSASSAAKQAMQIIISNKEFLTLIDRVTKEWQSNGLVHGDCKLSNFLIDEKGNIALIDWELADYGDTCWDLAGILQSYLLLWLMDDMMPQPVVKKTELSVVQQELSDFWQSYAAGMNYTAQENNAQLEKCTRFCAMKLVHACFEMTHDEERLTPYAAKILQMAFNILKSPAEAAEKLLGIKKLS